MDPNELYSADQINIPPTFPEILKTYVKSAIRTQPYDLLAWTSAYFRALANDEQPPVKERFDHPPFTHPTGLTPSYLRILFNQFGRPSYGSCVALKSLFHRWQGIALPDLLLYRILKIGHILHDEVDLYRFLAIACGLFSNNLLDTMIHICELLTSEPPGGSAMIPHTTLVNLYGYLAHLDCTGQTPQGSHEISSDSGETYPGKSNHFSKPIPQDSVSICTCEVSTKSLKNTTSDVSWEAGVFSQVTHGSESTKTMDEDKLLEDDVHSLEETDEMSTEVLANDHRSLEVVGTQEDPLPSADCDDSLNRSHGDPDALENVSGENSGEEFPGEYSSESETGVESLETLEKSRGNSPPEDIPGFCRCLKENLQSPGESSLENFADTFVGIIEEKYSPPRVDYFVPGIGDVVSIERVNAVQLWLMDCSRRQQGWVGPRNLRHFMCPRLFDECPAIGDCDDCRCDQ
ncbi:uncharacterized protein [Fopius arisanus]|uniref:Ropporin-1-like protein n=1 Tax=Fopius arisanus TaxID=64838 RepID=A0A9R1T5Y6_9HYME|nr:PREDICTED: uncharacterized protein LOC105266676 [Fopius arisanus]